MANRYDEHNSNVQIAEPISTLSELIYYITLHQAIFFVMLALNCSYLMSTTVHTYIYIHMCVES